MEKAFITRDSFIELNNKIIAEIRNRKTIVHKDLRFKSNIKGLESFLSEKQEHGYIVKKLTESDIYSVIKDNDILLVSDKQISLDWNSSAMFANVIFKSIDFDGVDTSEVGTLQDFFASAAIEKIKFNGLELPELVDMSCMFYDTRSEEVELSGLTAKKLEYAYLMFGDCRIKHLDLSGFKTNKNTNIENMFMYSSIDKLVCDDARILTEYNTREKHEGIFNKR